MWMVHGLHEVYGDCGDYASVRMRRRHNGSRFMYLCICVLYDCNSDSSKVVKNQVLVNAVQAQRANISNLIVLDF